MCFEIKRSAYTACYQTERVAFFFDRHEPVELVLNRDISLLTAKIYPRASLDGFVCVPTRFHDARSV